METRLKDLIHIEKVLTESQCDALIEERERRNTEEENEQCIHAFSGEMTQSTFTTVDLIPATKNFDVVKNACQTAINSWIRGLDSTNKFCSQALASHIRYSHKYRLMRYDVGGWIHPHIDSCVGQYGSLTIALNDETEYEGGTFKFFGGEESVRLKKGYAMIFPANPFFVHEVESVTKGVRYSVNTFLTLLPDEYLQKLTGEIHHLNQKIVEQGHPLMYNPVEIRGK